MHHTYTEVEIQNTAKKILGTVKSKSIAFYAPMGAGKTTLIRALVKELGGIDNISSPTFGLVNEYGDVNGNTLAYHFDFYRLTDEMEALDMGIEDYFYSDKWIFIEWPEQIPNLLPQEIQKIKIEIVAAATRKISFL